MDNKNACLSELSEEYQSFDYSRNSCTYGLGPAHTSREWAVVQPINLRESNFPRKNSMIAEEMSNSDVRYKVDSQYSPDNPNNYVP